MLDRAREFAIKAHGDQRYGKFPYVHHLDVVFDKLLALEDSGWNIPEDAYAVAYLHDVLEDTDYRANDISDEFGNTIAGAVVDLSKNYYEDLSEYITDIKKDPIAHIVKIADTLCNLQASINSVEPRRVKKYAEQLAKLMEK